MTKEEIIAAVKECAAKLGHVPSLAEFRKMSEISKGRIRKSFGTFTQLLTASGLEVQGPGHMVEMKDLFTDWAGIVRREKKVPHDYGLRIAQQVQREAVSKTIWVLGERAGRNDGVCQAGGAGRGVGRCAEDRCRVSPVERERGTNVWTSQAYPQTAIAPRSPDLWETDVRAVQFCADE